MIDIIRLLIFFSCSLFISIYDIKKLQIPLVVMYLILLTGIIVDILYRRNVFIFDIVAAASMCLLFILCRLITKKGLGLGDVQYSLVCGFYSGLPYFILGSLISSLAGIIFFLILIFQKKDIQNKKIPFAPFMSLGTVISIIISFKQINLLSN